MLGDPKIRDAVAASARMIASRTPTKGSSLGGWADYSRVLGIPISHHQLPQARRMIGIIWEWTMGAYARR
jgi:hypothetical protein